jgi:competence protein CoiA
VTLETYYAAIKQRADVVWQRAGQTLVLEFQCSPLNPERLVTRTRGYHQLGVTVVWVLGPRYYSKRPGTMQARFLQYSPRYGYHLWFSDGREFLEVWQWEAQGYRVTRYGSKRPVTRVIGTGRAKANVARLIQNQLHYREPNALTLQALAYQQGHHLAGAPWLIHERPLSLIGIKAPEWQLRVKFLLTLGQTDISREKFIAFWAAQRVPVLTPLVSQTTLIKLVAARWLEVLEDAQLLVATNTGWQWRAVPVWYPDLISKLNALR